MADSALKIRLTEAMKSAMRAQAKERLSAIRMVLADIKRIEVDERIDLDDARVLVILDKIAKQRRDSISQFRGAGRNDLADKEAFELTVVEEFLPQQLSEAEITALIDQSIAAVGATGPTDMGKVMALVKPAAQGRVDMAAVSKLIKARLG
ncbi:MAG: hypothetical protein JWM78_299 [Verrucomicrobiaceae bacterium]|nr:hypothetical protein [Verrucomicrobiaceae bacterium]